MITYNHNSLSSVKAHRYKTRNDDNMSIIKVSRNKKVINFNTPVKQGGRIKGLHKNITKTNKKFLQALGFKV